MRNFTWWQAFWLSFFSRQLYQSVARQWRGIGSLYLLILSALVVMPVTLEIRNGFQSFIEQDLPLYLDELPELTIQGGYASTPEDRPYIINEKGTTDPFIVIDTSGEFTSLEQTSAPVLITNDRLYIRKSDIETRSFDFSTFTDMTIDRELLDSFLSTTSKFVMPLTYVILVLFAWSWRITQAMLYALLAGWLAKRQGLVMRYPSFSFPAYGNNLGSFRYILFSQEIPVSLLPVYWKHRIKFRHHSNPAIHHIRQLLVLYGT